MIRRDWNHPSIILWGVRVNESGDDHDLYTRTNKLAHELDDTPADRRRALSVQFGAARRCFYDERFRLAAASAESSAVPQHRIFGHMFPTKRFDNGDRLREHTHRHARVHDALAA